MSPAFEFVQAQNSCVAHKGVWSLKSKDVMSCPHMKVVWGGEWRGGGGGQWRRVGMEMQSD